MELVYQQRRYYNMNSLSELNALGTSVIDVADSRPATVLFDLDLRYTSLDTQVTYYTNIQNVVAPINIVEIINYATANVRYRISVITGGSNPVTGTSITFPTLPAELTLTQVDDVYTISGLTSSEDWFIIKDFTWTLPVDYTSASLLFLQLEIIYFDQATNQDIIVDWQYFDDNYYYISSMKSIFDITATPNKIKSSVVNLTSAFVFAPDVRRFVRPAALNFVVSAQVVAQGVSTVFVQISSNFNVTASLTQTFTEIVNLTARFAPITIDGNLKLLTMQNITLPTNWNGPNVPYNDSLVKWSGNNNILIVAEPSTYLTTSTGRGYTFNADKTSYTTQNFIAGSFSGTKVMSVNDDARYIQQIGDSGEIYGVENYFLGGSIPGTNYYSSAPVSQLVFPGGSVTANGQYHWHEGEQYVVSGIIRGVYVRIRDAAQPTQPSSGQYRDTVVKSIIADYSAYGKLFGIRGSIKYNSTLGATIFAYLTTNRNLFVSYNLNTNVWGNTYDRNITLTNAQCLAMDHTGNYMVIGGGYQINRSFIQVLKKQSAPNQYNWSVISTIDLPGSGSSGHYPMHVTISSNATRISVLENLSDNSRRMHIIDKSGNDVFALAKTFSVGQTANIEFNSINYDVTNDGKYIAAMYTVENANTDTLKVYRII